MKIQIGTCAVLLAISVGASAASDINNPAMRKLAHDSGCQTCHSIEAGKSGPDGAAPIGPAWQDVAKKYASNKDAAHTVVPIVLNGSSPYESHWKGKVSGFAMPPNHAAITEADAKKLVDWILALPH